MADAQRHRHRVAGFGTHVDFKVLEFLEEPDNVSVCSYCGIAKQQLSILSCLHVVCDSCRDKFPTGVCSIDKKRNYLLLNGTTSLGDRKVRCLNADSGCDFAGQLRSLNDHLIGSCDFYLTTCLKCEGSVVFKDMTAHHPHCKGRGDETVVLPTADARSLLEDFGNAHSELQRALDSTTTGGGEELRAAVASLSEQFARLQSQLAVPETDTAPQRRD